MPPGGDDAPLLKAPTVGFGAPSLSKTGDGGIWRLMDSGDCSASFNMALDEAIVTVVRSGNAPPALRFYGWDRPSVSLGRFQRATDIDTQYCRANDVPIVRRPTGGRGILHDDELTYSFSARTDLGPFSKGLMESYRGISSAFSLALERTGVTTETKNEREKGRVLTGSPLCFQTSSYGEVLSAGRKVLGSAQRRWPDAMLQQGSLPYSHAEEMLRRIFVTGKDTDPGRCMTGLKAVIPGLDEGLFRGTVAACFENIFGISLVRCHPSDEELALAYRLEKEKYLQDSWTLRPA
ncbi:MAG: lipoate--protein ligase family protein [Nitrospirae bacterium]|nr:lipoate--protein ligase family protein [Nitrospirota bacterium]